MEPEGGLPLTLRPDQAGLEGCPSSGGLVELQQVQLCLLPGGTGGSVC